MAKKIAKKKAAKKSAAAGSKKTSAKKTGTKKKAASKKAAKRTLVNPGNDARFVRRSGTGRFKESDDVGKSLKADRRTKSKTRVKSGQGDRGDR